ncbi:MAG: type II toxin-antitoxin system VapC family toxin [Rhodospirillaceae bacterium]
MKYLLDSNAVIALLKGNPVFLARLRLCEPGDFGLPAIVAHELYFSAYKGQRTAENLARIDALRFEILDFDGNDARHAGLVRAGLAAAGTPIGPYDALIAGYAIARNLTLITRNTREFMRVPALSFEDWESV